MEKQGGIYARYSPGQGPRPDLDDRSPGCHVPRESRARRGSRLTLLTSTLTGAFLVRV